MNSSDSSASLRLPFLLWITGASGAGKSTAFHLLEERRRGDDWWFVHQDGEHVPAREAVNSQTASLTNIQEFLAHYWVEKFATAPSQVVVMDAQCHPRFVGEACARFGLGTYQCVLMHTDWDVMVARLAQRGQSELATTEMHNWSAHLLAYAQDNGVPTLDTTHQSPQNVADWLENQIQQGFVAGETS